MIGVPAFIPTGRAITVRSHERSLSNAKLIEWEYRLHASHLMAAIEMVD
jgi:hypothetical protein